MGQSKKNMESIFIVKFQPCPNKQVHAYKLKLFQKGITKHINTNKLPNSTRPYDDRMIENFVTLFTYHKIFNLSITYQLYYT